MNNLFIILTYSVNNTGHHSIHVESAQTTIDLLIETEKPSELFMQRITLSITSGVEPDEMD